MFRPALGAVFAAATLALLAPAASGESEPPAREEALRYPALADSKPFQRSWWSWEQRSYPLGYIPFGAKTRALEQIERWHAENDARAFSTSFFSIGPAPVLGGQIGATGGTRPMSGRVADIAIDPTDPSHWLVGGAQGGVWETSDSGATWTPLTDGEVSLATGAIAFAPSNTSILYVGTGEAAFAGDAYAGGGMLKSTDGGATWTTIGTAEFAQRSFSDIKVDPSTDQTVVAATARGTAGRGGGGPINPPPAGIYRSTNGGTTWTNTLAGMATDLEVDATNFANQFAGIGEIFGAAANGVYRSTNGGASWAALTGPWTALAGGVGRVELASAPSAPNTLYVSIHDAFDGVGNDGGMLGLWVSTDALATTPTWAGIALGPTDNGTGLFGYCGWSPAFGSASNQCWYDHEISVDPLTSTTLFAGGVPLWRWDGATWVHVSKTDTDPANGIHVDQHSMAWAGSQLVVGNDGGVWSTTDGGTTWSDHNTNLALTQYYDGSMHPTRPGFYLGGSQDNGTHLRTSTDAWTWIFGGDGADNAISSTDPNNDWAVSAQNLFLSRTTDGGGEFHHRDRHDRPHGDALHRAHRELCQHRGRDDRGHRQPVARARLLLGAGGAHLGSQRPGGGRADSLPGLRRRGHHVRHLRLRHGRRNDPADLRWRGDLDRHRCRKRRSGPNRHRPRVRPERREHPLRQHRWLRRGHTGSGGAPLQDHGLAGGEPLVEQRLSPPVNIPHNTVVVDPADSNSVYTGTDLAVWFSSDAGGTWTHLGPGQGLPNVAVFELEFAPDGNRLAAFTHGRGAFVISNVLFYDGFESGDVTGWAASVP